MSTAPAPARPASTATASEAFVSHAPWAEIAAARNAAIAGAGRWRTLRPLTGGGPAFRTAEGTDVISFASNDYLGLSQHPAVRAAAVEAIGRFGTGSGSARLIVGDRPLHEELELELAAWKGTEAALLFATGYTANLGVLSTLGTQGTLIVSDELNHASIIDGCRMARAAVAVAQHGDVDHVRDLLAGHRGPAIVATDTVFSMDGDRADLDGLAEVCAARHALLVLDDAHAVLDARWRPPETLEWLRVGTLSKTLGALGGFVAGTRDLIDLLLNTARAFIFTTGSSPADTAAALAALRILRSEEGDALLTRLRANVDRVRGSHPSPIVPVTIGDEHAALRASSRLLDDHGLLVPAIRPPTVPAGTSRLRIALSAAHTEEHVNRLLDALTDI